MTVMAITRARNNAELMLDTRTLGYITDHSATLDPTYGLGRFWTLWQPTNLTASDIDPQRSPLGRPVDFTTMPWDDHTFDVVVLDGPYKLNGTAGSCPSDDGYGVATTVRWQDRHTLIRAGITESVRVLKPGGVLMVKCQDQVCSGAKRFQTREFADHTEQHDCRLIDALHLQSYRPQPPGRRQLHSRANYSTLLIFRKARP